MKKLLVSLVLCLFIIGLFAVPAFAEPVQIGDTENIFIKTGPKPLDPTVVEGWEMSVGEIRLMQDGSNYYLHVQTWGDTEGYPSGHWYVLEYHFAYSSGASNFNDIPRTPRSLNPIPGKFPYSGDFWNEPQWKFDVPISGLSAGQTYTFLFHAVVGYSTDGGETFVPETVQTGWGDCHLIEDCVKWAKYWNVTIP